jgi:ferredoxin-NADP reductase
MTVVSGIGRPEGEQAPVPAGRIILQEEQADLVVKSRDHVADGVVALSLVDPEGHELSGGPPGAHIDVELGESLVRQYSLCSSPADANVWRIGVLLDPNSRGGSRFIHDELEAESVVRIRGPRNHFPLVEAPRYQFIAGGIGITPILPMIESAVANEADWGLLYGGRRRDSMAFLDELAAYGDRVRVWPQDEKGLMDLEAVLGSSDRSVGAASPRTGLAMLVAERRDLRAAASAPPASPG